MRLPAQAYTFTTFAGNVGPGKEDGIGNAVRFYLPYGVATDSAGNIYVADTSNHTIRKSTPAGVVTTLAGLAGNPGSADGTGSGARFNGPRSVATDSAGNVFVADTNNNTIRKITPSGVVTTLAEAGLNQPSGVATDIAGNVYIADTQNCTIRKVGVRIFGLNGFCGSQDGTGSVVRFNLPSGVAVDRWGTVYVADTGNHTIRKIMTSGQVVTFAGLAGSPGSADGNPSRFFNPSGVATDNAGNIYVADTGNHAIRKITPIDQVVTTLAGLGCVFPGPTTCYFGSTDGTGSAARFNTPFGAATDSAGNIYVADTNNHTIRKITPAGVVATFAGQAAASSFGSADGTGISALFYYPSGVATDSSGNIYVADYFNHTIRKITPAGVVTTLAGLAGSPGSANGTGSGARFRGPFGVATDIAGNVYVADRNNYTIRRITPAGVVTTLAGLALSPGSADGTGSTARFSNPSKVATDSAGFVYVADTTNYTIRKISPVGVVTTLAGLAGNLGSADGTGSAARFSDPYGVATDGAGNVYVADQGNSTIRKITSGAVVTTLAGLAGSPGSADGTGTGARFNQPFGVATDGAGNVFVADRGNSTIRRIISSSAVTTLAGLAGVTGNADGTGSGARFYYPTGVATDSAGNVYVADQSNHTIRKGSSAIADIATIDSANNVTGLVRQLDAAPQTAVNWSWRFILQPGASSAVLSSTTIRNPTFTPDAPDLYQFRLTATDATGRSSISTVQLDAGCPLILASPASRDVCAGSATTFTVSSSGNPNPSYQWNLNGAPITGGTSASYSIASVTTGNAGNYTCTLANSCGTTTTAAANMTVSTVIPTAVGNSQSAAISGTNLLLKWIDIAGATSYSIYQDNSASGAFSTVAGTSVSGSTGLYIPMPVGNSLFFKVAGINGCGTGPK